MLFSENLPKTSVADPEKNHTEVQRVQPRNLLPRNPESGPKVPLRSLLDLLSTEQVSAFVVIPVPREVFAWAHPYILTTLIVL